MSTEESKEISAEDAANSKASPQTSAQTPDADSGAGEVQGEAEGEAADGDVGEVAAEPDWKDMYARMRADFDNYRKRVSRDREVISGIFLRILLRLILVSDLQSTRCSACRQRMENSPDL